MRKIPVKILETDTDRGCASSSSFLEISLPKELAGLLKRKASQSWLVGGAVRDWLLDSKPQDFDFLLAGIDYQALKSSLPGIKMAGNSFSVILYQGFEINLLSDNQALSRELSRRDFTINSLAVNLQEGMIRDPQGGFFDIRKRYLQAIPGSLQVDPCRLYRGCRLLAELPEFEPTDFTLASFRNISRKGLTEIAGERIYQELDRVLGARSPENFFTTLLQAKKIDVHFPGLADNYIQGCRRLKQLREFTSRKDMAFAALVLDLEFKSEKFSNLWEKRISLPAKWLAAVRLAGELLNILRYWRSQPADKILTLRERVDRAAFSLRDLIFLAVSEDLGENKSRTARDLLADYQELADLIDEMEEEVTASDLLREMESGPELGKKLRRQRAEWLEKRL